MIWGKLLKPCKLWCDSGNPNVNAQVTSVAKRVPKARQSIEPKRKAAYSLYKLWGHPFSGLGAQLQAPPPPSNYAETAKAK